MRQADKKHTLNVLEELYRYHFAVYFATGEFSKCCRWIVLKLTPLSLLLTLNTFSTRKKDDSTQRKYLFSEAMRTGSPFFTLRSRKHRSNLHGTIFRFIAKLLYNSVFSAREAIGITAKIISKSYFVRFYCEKNSEYFKHKSWISKNMLLMIFQQVE